MVLRSFVLLGAALAAQGATKPNIVFFLTDDQDQKLGGSFPQHNGVGPMPYTQREMVEKGATATNWFIHTPICCPSRSELVAGRYFHNIKKSDGCPNGHAPEECCMHVDEDLVNNATFARVLKEQGGYTTGIFGKYLNSSPKKAPIGFDAYFANGGGTYYSPSFFVQGVEGFNDGTWTGGPDNYTTAVVGNVSNAWIRRVVEKNEKPFFAYIAPKACHEPFLPAPWYEGHWDPSWPPHEPRPVSWNCSFESRADHHYTIATEPMITDGAAAKITQIFQDRWRTLMSVDDVIRDTMELCAELGVMDNTYFFYSSDHGFQLGEFNIPFDKRHVYDHDIRIHMLARGPGIGAGTTFDILASQVDLAPTWLALAGVAKPPYMDGKSVLPFLLNGERGELSEATRKLLAATDEDTVRATWRDSMFIEYYFNANNTKCIPNCYNTEDASNNYIAIRHVEGEYGDTLYSEFQTAESGETLFDAIDFYEYYNLTSDNWQMDNLYNATKAAAPQVISSLHTKLRMWYACAGDECP